MPDAVAIVSTRQRPDLAAQTGRWRWEAFFRGAGLTLEDTLAAEERGIAGPAPLPTVLVLLADGEAVGMAALAEHDLDARPDLSPWLAGVYVHPDHRGRGHAARLVAAVEDLARGHGWTALWLYTGTAEGLYGRLGWLVAERFARGDRDLVLMRRDLSA